MPGEDFHLRGEQGSDTSINLQGMSVPITHPLPVLLLFPSTISQLPCLQITETGKKKKKTSLSLEENRKVTNICIFFCLQLGAYQYAA